MINHSFLIYHIYGHQSWVWIADMSNSESCLKLKATGYLLSFSHYLHIKADQFSLDMLGKPSLHKYI